MNEPLQGVLFPEPDPAVGQGDRRIVINGRCQLLASGGDRVVIVQGVVVAHIRDGDRVGEAHAMVSLVDLGHAQQNEVARAFGCSDRSVRRYQGRFATGGLAALGRPDGYPAGRPRLKAMRIRMIERLKAEGHSNRAIASRLGVTEKAIRKVLKRLGWQAEKPQAVPLSGLEDADPNLSEALNGGKVDVVAAPHMTASSEGEAPFAGADQILSVMPEEGPEDAFSFSLDTDPLNRANDRMLAYHGLIADALPIFAPGKAVPGAGVLLALPILLASGVLECASDVYGSLGPAFHGLRTTIVTFLLMSLLRIKRPEGLKEHSPKGLGRILGLDRVMEVKTLRRKLARLASMGRATAFGQLLSKRRIEALGPALGFLYVDGHVRVYNGKQDLPKAHVTRLRIALPSTTDYFVNDERGDPLFVVTAPANAGLTKMLPVMVVEAKALIPGRRMTVVFDRGGYCFDLFKMLIAEEVDLLTYRKGTHDPVPVEAFHECSFTHAGETLTYCLADEEVTLCKDLTLRQITRLCENGHQTTILTSRRDLVSSEVAFRMFERWRQENFFKYMREEFALDALVDYGTEPDDAEREVPNPVWRGLDAQLRKARTELERLCAHFGLDVILDKENLRELVKPSKARKRATTDLEGPFIEAARRAVDLQKARDAVPRRVPIGQVSDGEVRKLTVERKHLTTVLKMAAYRAESDLFQMLRPYYARSEDEGRTLLQSAFNAPADFEVTPTELRVTLSPLSSPHRTKAIAALCQELNKSPVRYPGTNLILCFAVADLNPETGQF